MGDGSKFIHFESVTVSQEGMEVSISSHIIRENLLRKKLKNDRLLYKATALDAPAKTSAEQPINGGSHSSASKDKSINSNSQDDNNKETDKNRVFRCFRVVDEDGREKAVMATAFSGGGTLVTTYTTSKRMEGKL